MHHSCSIHGCWRWRCSAAAVTSNTVAEQLVKMIPDLVNRVNNLIAQNREKKEQEEFDELNI